MTTTVVLLLISNCFMTLAWYGHLKFFKDVSLPKVILLSWGIALFEYMFQVPANRFGYQVFSATQLKILQECITLVVFVLFAVFVLNEPLRWNYLAAFGLVLCAVWLTFAVHA